MVGRAAKPQHQVVAEVSGKLGRLPVQERGGPNVQRWPCPMPGTTVAVGGWAAKALRGAHPGWLTGKLHRLLGWYWGSRALQRS